MNQDFYAYLVSTAHCIVRRAIFFGELRDLKSGKTVRCIDCGKRASMYDHRDYTKPLEVEPVCRGCNKNRGSANGAPVKQTRRANIVENTQTCAECCKKLPARIGSGRNREFCSPACANRNWTKRHPRQAAALQEKASER